MDNADNLIVEHLRAIRSDIKILQADTKEIKSRVNSLEVGQAAIIKTFQLIIKNKPSF